MAPSLGQTADRSTDRELPADAGRVVANRYCLEAPLGEGATATVFRALDRNTGEHIALKCLRRQDDARNVQRQARFEREFQTLQNLAHPRIIRVYDYGLDSDQPYYTMELLEGRDLSELAPIKWRAACRLLRDVASSLAIVHSRRLVHRDVSARNVRWSRDGRAKLLDFGAMTPVGVARDVVGTPPFMPPEVLYSQYIDGRTDVYALGALAYWLLTRRHAYPARGRHSLREIWRAAPLEPSAIKSDVPPAVDQLVMSMLSLDPVGRPVSAAEVIERLTAVADLEASRDLDIPRAYLINPTLVGRVEAIETARRQIGWARRGAGCALMYEGASGIGRTRLLAEVRLEASLAGAVVLHADAATSQQNDYAVASHLLDQLIKAHPEGIQCLTDDSGAVRALLGDEAPASASGADTPGERARTRRLVHRWLCDSFREITEREFVAVLIDDVHLIDEPSLAFLALLAQHTLERRLTLITTIDSGAADTSATALKMLRQQSLSVELRPLAPIETEMLVQSVFGDVPNVQLLSDRIHASSEGNPRVCTEIAQYLVDNEHVEFSDGHWLLPERLPTCGIPRSLEDALAETAGALPREALALARGLALSPQSAFTLYECKLLMQDFDPTEVHRALEVLVAHRLVSTDGDSYCMAQPGWARVVTERLDDAARKVLHGRLAEICSARGGREIDVAYHLLSGGAEQEAIDTLLAIPEADYLECANLERAAETVEWAIRAAQQAERRPGEAIRLRALALVMGSRHEQLFYRHWPTVLNALRYITGLHYWEQLEHLEPSERIIAAIERAQADFDNGGRATGSPHPADAIFDLTRLAMMASGVAASNYDRELAESIPPLLKPFRTLSPAIEMTLEIALGGVAVVVGRKDEASERYRRALDRLDSPDGLDLDASTLEAARHALLYGIGMLEADEFPQQALRRAERLEAHPDYAANAWGRTHVCAPGTGKHTGARGLPAARRTTGHPEQSARDVRQCFHTAADDDTRACRRSDGCQTDARTNSRAGLSRRTLDRQPAPRPGGVPSDRWRPRISAAGTGDRTRTDATSLASQLASGGSSLRAGTSRHAATRRSTCVCCKCGGRMRARWRDLEATAVCSGAGRGPHRRRRRRNPPLRSTDRQARRAGHDGTDPRNLPRDSRANRNLGARRATPSNTTPSSALRSSSVDVIRPSPRSTSDCSTRQNSRIWASPRASGERPRAHRQLSRWIERSESRPSSTSVPPQVSARAPHCGC